MSDHGDERKYHILIIEDNPADVDLLRLALRSAQLDCVLAVMEDGAEAMTFIRQEGKYAGAPLPDLAVLDLNLPKNDGLEVLQAMRASEVFAHVPVAILSSSAAPRERARLRQFRIDRYITKPADLDEFLRIGWFVKELLTRGTLPESAPAD